MFTGLGEYYCICESGIKSYVAPEEAACNLSICRFVALWVMHASSFEKQPTGQVLLSDSTAGLIMDSLKTTDQNNVLLPSFLLLFKTWHLNYPQCNLATASESFQ